MKNDKRLNRQTRDFADVHQNAATFINEVKDKLSGENINLSPNLTEICSNRRSKLHTAVERSTTCFDISCHNVIVDTVIQRFNR